MEEVTSRSRSFNENDVLPTLLELQLCSPPDAGVEDVILIGKKSCPPFSFTPRCPDDGDDEENEREPK